MDFDEIDKLIKQGKSRQEIQEIIKAKHPQPIFKDTHRGISLKIDKDLRVSGSGWIYDGNDDRIELGMEFLVERYKSQKLRGVVDGVVTKKREESATNSKNATKYTEDIVNRIFEIVSEEKIKKNERYPALQRAVDRINTEFKKDKIRIEDSPSLSNLLSRLRKQREINKK